MESLGKRHRSQSQDILSKEMGHQSPSKRSRHSQASQKQNPESPKRKSPRKEALNKKQAKNEEALKFFKTPD